MTSDLILNPALEIDTDALAAYASTLAHHAGRIARLVHSPDIPRSEVGEAIDRALIVEAPAGVDPVHALVAMLAAQVDADISIGARLAWIDDTEPARGAA